MCSSSHRRFQPGGSEAVAVPARTGRRAPRVSLPALCLRLALASSVLLGVAVYIVPRAARADASHHVGYYYPKPDGVETYTARSTTLAGSDRRRRILFVTELTNQMLANPYPPPFAVFAKGDKAQQMIITSLYSNGYNTLYRMRALLAMLTARARATPMFQSYKVDDLFTFLDLLKMLGFKLLTVTDGDSFAHQYRIR